MVTHLSVRICWHDSGWNGAICKSPETNHYCSFLEYIRENRTDVFKAFENENKKKHLTTFDCNNAPLVPCRGEIAVYSKKGYNISWNHPLKGIISAYNGVAPCDIEGEAYSFSPAPYRWVMVENYDAIRHKEDLVLPDLTRDDLYYPSGDKKTWIEDVRLQGVLLGRFWEKIEDNKSLVVFYVNSSPVVEDQKRLVVGIGRIKEKYKQTFYGKSIEKPGPNYVWQRRLSQDPNQGFRLPYQEYIEQGLDVKKIALVVPEDFENEFKYVTEHVTNGAMLYLCERLTKIIDQIEKDIENGAIKLPDDWHRNREWVQKVIGELWQNRGKYPGIGSVLRYLGFSKGLSYHQEVVMELEKETKDSLGHVVDILDGKKQAETRFTKDFENAKHKWSTYSKDKGKRELLKLLMRFEVTEDQVERIIKEELRHQSGIHYTEAELADNPYLIAENDRGLFDENGDLVSERISLDDIDQGMIPIFQFEDKYQLDDDRRIRAILVEELKKAADEGDTILSTKEAMEKVRQRFTGERACKPDLFLIRSNQEFYEKKGPIAFFGDDNSFVALKEMREKETTVSSALKEIVETTYNEKAPDWNRLLVKRFGEVTDSPLGKDLEEKTRAEKIEALKTLYANKFSVLTGRAGTGKTEVLTLLIEGLIKEGHLDPRAILVLAPTGKARVRINKNLDEYGLGDIQARTIHQHLNEYGWLDENFELRSSGGEQKAVDTVIVDECSMLAIDLFATLIKSIDVSKIKRLIMTGDPNQLPPIGPGRPFDDIVVWLSSDEKKKSHIANLKVRVRQKERKESLSLRLADGFLRDTKSKNIEEIYSLILKNKLKENDDLYFASWTDNNELLAKIDEVLQKLGVFDYESYRNSVGIKDRNIAKCESWQVLSPVKFKEVSGTISLNNYLQEKFLGEKLARWRTRGYYGPGKHYPKPFGKTKDIIHEDKVIQLRNTRKLKCYPSKTEPYVANGEIGITRWTFQNGKYAAAMNVSFSDQPNYSYTYWNGEHERSVELNLDLAYSITIHKSQGSDFDNVILVIPRNAFNISMEMMYTSLTRFKQKTYLLVQDGLDTLEKYRHVSKSETDKRNTFLFRISARESADIPYVENRIHTTKNGFLVRSKSEVIIANELINAGIPLGEDNYERKLHSKADQYDYKLPDFTFEYNGKQYYWEHFGMLAVDEYKKSTEAKLKWYEDNGYVKQLITSQDGLDGSINSEQIGKIIKEKLGIEIKKAELSIDALDESIDVEFKSSIGWDYYTNQKNRALEQPIAKTIAGFMNTEGGLLVIGIDDQKKVLGLSNDFKLLKKQDEDGFKLKITEIVSNYVGKEFAQLIECAFELKENQKVALVKIKRSPDEPTYMTVDGQPKFYIRTANSTQELNVKESNNYIKKHWPGYL